MQGASQQSSWLLLVEDRPEKDGAKQEFIPKKSLP
jgi:hypothetical protein